MTFKAVLDACVLYPFSLRDTLLRLAESELYDAVWSERILEELTRNVVNNKVMTQAQADRLTSQMAAAFDDALVDSDAIEALEHLMTNHPKDRHVLAAAVASSADVVITMNLKDFPEEACRSYRVRAIHPDEFLSDMLHSHQQTMMRILEEQASDLADPPTTCAELMEHLRKVVPAFVDGAKAVLDNAGATT